MKQITIINGLTDDSDLAFEQELGRTLDKHKDNIRCEVFHIRDMNINYCCGCWSCWVKTPGKCIQKDEMPKLLQSIIHSDLTIFVSPVLMGFVSANIKKINDKMIPLVHPYIDIFNGECHHIRRYDRYPKLGLILLDKQAQSKDSHEIITAIYRRLAINMKTELAFSILTGGTMEEVDHALNHI